MKFGFLPVIFIIITLAGCTGGKMSKNVNFLKEKIAISDIEILESEKIYFAHQSVGYNIMDGISDVVSNFNNTLNIVETSNTSLLGSSFFAHSRIGENTKPETKIKEFSENLNNGIGNLVDVAFLKLCFVDINAETDVKSLFKEYQSVFNKLKLQYPHVTFIHFSDPLVVKQTGLKAFIKKILGREVGGGRDNLKRQEYNELLRKAYSGKEPLFDIAKIESTKPDGSREVHSLDGEEYFSMFRGYTTDGGHLNKLGRDLIARNLIKVISDLQPK